MKSYLFYLEPYVLLDVCGNSCVLINTLDDQKLIYHSLKISKMLLGLFDLKSATVTFAEQDFSLELTQFLHAVREMYMGDYIEIESLQKAPFQFPLFNSYEKILKKNLLGRDINYISDLVFILNSHKHLAIDSSETLQSLSVSNFMTFLNHFRGNPNVCITLKGDNIFLYKELDSIINYINNEKPIILSFDYRNYLPLCYLKDHACLSAKVDIPICGFEREKFNSFICSVDIDVEYIFQIQSLDEYELALNIIAEYSLERYKILPSYNGRNIDFFRTYVFNQENDIVAMKLSKKQFMANHLINILSFGKIFILPNGLVYTDLLKDKIGSIDDSPIKLSNRCLEETSQWMNTRFFVDPCKTCVYRSICPPIGEFESSLGMNHLCFKNI